MVLDVVFVNEVWDFGGIFERVCSVDGAVDEEFDALFDGFVD